MGTDRTSYTREEARERLAASRTPTLGNPGDRLVHAISTAAIGLIICLWFAMRNMMSETSGTVLACVYVALCFADAIWVERAARTVPRRAKLWSWLGIGASIVLSLGLVLPWLNLHAQTEPNTWSMVIAGALVAALPSLIASAVIARGSR